jgi:purine nucleosidase
MAWDLGMTKLHIDTDIGGDIDDFCALAMALNWPGVEIVGITTVAEHQGKRAGFAHYVTNLASRGDIPVSAGADASLDRDRYWQGLPDEATYWPEPIACAPVPMEQTLDLLEHSIDQGATLVALGAFTNLALLEQRSPGILRHAKLYLMGGYVYPPRAGFPAWSHDFDFNVQIDARSARFVIENSNPVFTQLAVTAETSLRRAYLPALHQAGPVARLIARQAEGFAKDENHEQKYGQTCKGLPADTINFLHDPLACAIALGFDDGVEIREILLRTEMRDGWLCHTVDAAGKPTRVVTKVDGEKFGEFWLHTVIRASSGSANSDGL